MVGKRVCYNHGGMTPRGRDSPHHRTGRHSRYLPERLVERYQEALDDEELTRLDSEIALVDTKIQDVLTRLEETGEGPGAWAEVQQVRAQLRRAEESADANAKCRARERFDAAIDAGREEQLTWRVVMNLVEQRRKLVETELKHRADEERFITVERLMILVAAIVDIMRRHIADPETRRKIADEIRCLAASNPDPS